MQITLNKIPYRQFELGGGDANQLSHISLCKIKTDYISLKSCGFQQARLDLGILRNTGTFIVQCVQMSQNLHTLQYLNLLSNQSFNQQHFILLIKHQYHIDCFSNHMTTNFYATQLI